jgi:hypothetical protein
MNLARYQTETEMTVLGRQSDKRWQTFAGLDVLAVESQVLNSSIFNIEQTPGSGSDRQ